MSQDDEVEQHETGSFERTEACDRQTGVFRVKLTWKHCCYCS